MRHRGGGTRGAGFAGIGIPHSSPELVRRLWFGVAAAEVSPAFAVEWADTSDAARYRLEHSRQNSPLGEGSGIGPAPPFVADYFMLDRQYVSRPLLGSGTVSGAISVQLMMRASNSGIDSAVLGVRVVSGDGGTERGSCRTVNYAGPLGALPAALTNRQIAASEVITTIAHQHGDRIVVELGYGVSGNEFVDNPLGFALFGDIGPDLPQDNSWTDPLRAGWIEFSRGLRFQ